MLTLFLAWYINENVILGPRRQARAARVKHEQLSRELERAKRRHRELDGLTLEPQGKKEKLRLKDRVAFLTRALARPEFRRLGSGGAGVVYAATSVHGDKCAAKIGDVAHESRMLKSSPNFVRAHYHRENVLILERLGPSLEDLLWACTAGCGGFSEPTVRAVAFAVAPALQDLKRLNIVHGDVKPDNILIDLKGSRLCLIDFGLAQNVGTPRDVFRGTEAFASEAALRCEPCAHHDDLWGFVTTLKYLLTGTTTLENLPTSPTSFFVDALLSTTTHDESYATLAMRHLRDAPALTECDWSHVVTWDDEGILVRLDHDAA